MAGQIIGQRVVGDHIERGDNDEIKDENYGYINRRCVDVWFDTSTIDLGTIRKRLIRRSRELGASEAIDEQQLQGD